MDIFAGGAYARAQSSVYYRESNPKSTELGMKPAGCSAADSNDAAHSNTLILHLEKWSEKKNLSISTGGKKH